MSKVRYCYWEENMTRPTTLPVGCEWSEDSIKWFHEKMSPSSWGGDYKRRWPSRMDPFDDLFIRACKNVRLNTVYRFRRIMAKRCGIETKYAGMYGITMHLWELIQEYDLVRDQTKVVEEFMRPLYTDRADPSTWNGLCRKDEYPDFGHGKEQILASFLIATSIIRHAQASRFEDISRPAWFRNKYGKQLTKEDASGIIRGTKK